MNNRKIKGRIDRRTFLHSAAAAGAGLALSPMVIGQTQGAEETDDRDTL
jgi:hypothetical protein